MKKVIIFAVLISVTFNLVCQEKYIEITAQDCFSLLLPEDWTAIGKDELFRISLNNPVMKKKSKVYSYGYEKMKSPGETDRAYPPSVLILIDNVGRWPENELKALQSIEEARREYKTQNDETVLLELFKKRKDFIICDSKHQLIWGYMNIHDYGIETLTVLKLTKNGVIQLDFGCSQLHFEEYFPTFVKISKSMTIDKTISY